MSSPSVPDVAAAVDAALPGELYEADSLLPGPGAVVDRLTTRLADPQARPATFAVIGLLPGDDDWCTSPVVLSTVTALLAGGLRADDWLARSGAAEFAVLVAGDPDAAEVAIGRMVAAVSGVITGIAASAGLAGVDEGLTASEVRRRAAVCLAAARSQGGGRLVRYRGTR